MIPRPRCRLFDTTTYTPMKRPALESDYSSPYFTPLHTANKKARLMTSRARTRTRDTPEIPRMAQKTGAEIHTQSQFTCRVGQCEDPFVSKEHLVSHIRSMHTRPGELAQVTYQLSRLNPEPAANTFTCNIRTATSISTSTSTCTSSFPNKESYITHIQNLHAQKPGEKGEAAFKLGHLMAWCEIGNCFKGFVGEVERDTHMRVTHGRGREAEPRNSCARKCVIGRCREKPKVFGSELLLVEHYWDAHRFIGGFSIPGIRGDKQLVEERDFDKAAADYNRTSYRY